MSNLLPETDSLRKLARFWDEHDITDFEESLEEVTESVFSKEMDIMVHLRQSELKSLKKIADKRGLKNTELIHEWIMEKIRAA